MVGRYKLNFWRWWYTKVHPSTSKYTRPEALDFAKKNHLEWEILQAMDHGCTPDEALQEWDIYPSESTADTKQKS